METKTILYQEWEFGFLETVRLDDGADKAIVHISAATCDAEKLREIADVLTDIAETLETRALEKPQEQEEPTNAVSQ